MKGLLTKDFKLIMKQKSVFIIWLVMALFLLIVNSDPIFGVSYSMFLMIIMLVGTVSYDDYDNGMGFLMTLPISRKTYAIEKYVLVIGGAFISGVFISICSMIYLQFRPDVLPVGGFLLIATILFLISALFASIMLPVQQKYGAEKGRIILVVFAGVIFVITFLARKMEVFLQPWWGSFTTVFAMISNAGPAVLILGLCVITTFVVLLSIGISVRILEKEEY